jgi:hypothetical protein
MIVARVAVQTLDGRQICNVEKIGKVSESVVQLTRRNRLRDFTN